MSDMAWEEPPPARTGGGDTVRQRFITALRERPGQWAIYPLPARGSIATRFRKEGYEVRQRTVDGEARLYVRVSE